MKHLGQSRSLEHIIGIMNGTVRHHTMNAIAGIDGNLQLAEALEGKEYGRFSNELYRSLTLHGTTAITEVESEPDETGRTHLVKSTSDQFTEQAVALWIEHGSMAYHKALAELGQGFEAFATYLQDQEEYAESDNLKRVVAIAQEKARFFKNSAHFRPSGYATGGFIFDNPEGKEVVQDIELSQPTESDHTYREAFVKQAPTLAAAYETALKIAQEALVSYHDSVIHVLGTLGYQEPTTLKKAAQHLALADKLKTYEKAIHQTQENSTQEGDQTRRSLIGHAYLAAQAVIDFYASMPQTQEDDKGKVRSQSIENNQLLALEQVRKASYQLIDTLYDATPSTEETSPEIGLAKNIAHSYDRQADNRKAM
ncbi:MAG: hypothetical protein H6502_00605 [Candidatus Woesearchaeota archaeon]|nr:MAG: hypothetical protein H6502_00605 [Candidatus Woesearchaeota archaeon]